jgi:hypothetical protein
METNITNPKIKNTWKPIAITAIVASLLLACSTIFFALNNNQVQDNNETDTGEGEQASSNTGSDESETLTDTANYFVVNEWGVKFAIPEGLESPIYRIDNRPDGNESITVTVSEFSHCGFGGLLRHEDRENLPHDYKYNNSYYLFLHPQVLCTIGDGIVDFDTLSGRGEEAEKILELIQTMLTVPLRPIR